MARTHEQRELTAERRAHAVEMRRNKATFAEIGEYLGVGRQRAHDIYLAALRDIPAKQVEQHRMEQIELALTAIDDLLEIARDHRQPRTAVEAWNATRGWAERLAKTTGADAPLKVDATVTEMSQQDLELQEMIREARAKVAAEEEQLKAAGGPDHQ